MKSSLAKAIADYIGGLVIGQGRYAGERFKLLAWQRRFLSGAFGQPDDAALSMGRGNGKSTFTAAIACAAVDVDAPLVESMAESLIVASSFDQGLVNFRHMLHFLAPTFEKHGTGPRGRFWIRDSANRATITDRETGAMVRVLGSGPRRLHGSAPKLLLLDEIAQWPPERVGPMLAGLTTSRGKIPGGKALWLGTRPAMPDHPFQRSLDGHGVGFRLCYAADKDDPPFQRRTRKRANPGLDHLPDLEAVVRSEAEDAKRDESAMQSFRALRLNQGVSDTTVSVLVDADTWRGAEALPKPDSRTNEYVLGLDLGQNEVMSAAAAYFHDGTLEAVACFHELPSLAERGLADGVGDLYRRMAEQGELFQAGRRVSDIPTLLRECLERWGQPVAIACDRWRLAELKQHLEAVSFPLVELVERGQGFKDGGADVRDFRAAVLGDHVRPSRSLLVTAAMREARVTGDPSGNWKLAKRVQGGRRANAREELRRRDCSRGRRLSPVDCQAVAPDLALSRRGVSRNHVKLNACRRSVVEPDDWRQEKQHKRLTWCGLLGGWGSARDA